MCYYYQLILSSFLDRLGKRTFVCLKRFCKMFCHLYIGFAVSILLILIDPEDACGTCGRTIHPQEFICDDQYFVLKAVAGASYIEFGRRKVTVTVVEDYKVTTNNGNDIVIDLGDEFGSCEYTFIEEECYVITGSVSEDGYKIYGSCFFKRTCSSLTSTQITGFGGEYQKGCSACRIKYAKTVITETRFSCIIYRDPNNDCLVDNAICKKPDKIRCRRHDYCGWVTNEKDQCK